MGGYLGIFGDWSKGDILADDGVFGGVQDNRRTQNYTGVKWKGQDGNWWYKDQEGVRKNQGARHTNYSVIDDPNRPGQQYQAQDTPQDTPQYSYSDLVGGGYSRGGSGSRGGGGSYGIQDQAERDMTVGLLNNQKHSLEEKLGLIGKHKKSVLNQIGDAYNKGKNRLNQQQSDALTRYKTQRSDTKADFQDSVSDVDRQTYNNFQALQGLLGRAGAGSSSAAQELVPYAVSQNASKTRGKISDAYGRNLRDLREAEGATNQSYKNSLDDLEEQKRTKTAGAESDFLNRRSVMNSQLASIEADKVKARGGSWKEAQANMGKYTSAISDNERALAGLMDQYRNPVSVKDVQARDVKAENYSADMDGVKVDDPNGTGYDTDTSAEYLARLKEERERKKKNNQASGMMPQYAL